MTRTIEQRIRWTWVSASIALILLATLTPQPEWSAVRQDFFSLAALYRGNAWRDVLQNVLLYLPFGLLIGLKRVSLVRTLLAAVLVSLATELLQLVVPGREAAVIDVATNTAGAFTGWIISATPLDRPVRRMLFVVESWGAILLRPDRRVAAALSLAWAALVSLVFGATCWLLAPVLPPPFFYAVAAPSIDASPGPVRIGSDGTPRGVFNGLIDEVRIYSRARSDDEIRADMERPVSNGESTDPDLRVAQGFDSSDGEEPAAAAERDEPVVRNARRTASGRFGGALALDGRASDGFVSNESVDLRRGMTLEAWVFPAGPMRGDVPVIAAAGDTFYLRASSFLNPSVPSSGAHFGGASRTLRLNQPIPPRRWTHLATTYDGRLLKMYVDGRVIGEAIVWSSHQPVRMTLDDADLPFGPVPNPASFHLLLSDAFSLRMSVRCGELQNRAAPVFVAAGIQSVDALAIEAAAAELRVRYPSRARRWGFGSADYRVPGALSSCEPGAIRSFAVSGPLQSPLVADSLGATMWGTGPGIASGWTVPVDSQLLPVWLVVTLSCCYLALLTFPFGFWARPSPLTVLGGVLLAASLFLFPLASRMRGPDVPQGIGVVAGGALGVVAARQRGSFTKPAR